jgi:hypothetical protein
MSRPLKPGKKSVELDPAARPSRIRRDPVPVAQSADRKLNLRSSEREIWLAIIGIVLFALAIDLVIVGISAHWG